MKIKRFVGGTLESNGYVVFDNNGGHCFIIDPGYNPGKFIEFVKKNELIPSGIVLTHLHHDHVGGAEGIKDEFDCDIMMHEDDAFVYKGEVDVYLKNHDKLTLDNETMEVLHTPGHTKGSICIMCSHSRICFTGDTIFDTDLGRTDLEGGSEADMIHSIKSVISKWDNDITIYPGHDSGCNMKLVRQYNTEFLELESR